MCPEYFFSVSYIGVFVPGSGVKRISYGGPWSK